MIAEYDNSGNLLRRYVHGPNVDEPLAWYEGSGTNDRRYPMADERGSVIGIANSSGTVTSVNRYDAYGVPAPSNTGRFQYTGQMWLSDLGLYHYKARAYHPQLGRFMQTDPIGVAGGINLYEYGGGGPVNSVDPFGLCVHEVRVSNGPIYWGAGPGNTAVQPISVSCLDPFLDGYMNFSPDFYARLPYPTYRGPAGDDPVVARESTRTILRRIAHHLAPAPQCNDPEFDAGVLRGALVGQAVTTAPAFLAITALGLVTEGATVPMSAATLARLGPAAVGQIRLFEMADAAGVVEARLHGSLLIGGSGLIAGGGVGILTHARDINCQVLALRQHLE